jgi:predicted aldo/keto reductase-like oxidoreductase
MADINKSRRSFLTKSVSGLAAAGVLGYAPGIAFGQDKEKQTEGEIIYRTLGRTGLKVPIVSMGVMNANKPEIVQASYELGIRHFDTAARYQYGRNEQMVGSVIKKLGVRDKVIIGTKEIRPSDAGEVSGKTVKERFITLCEGSMKRLKTDYIDILYVHSIRTADEVNHQETLEAVTELKKQGKVRYIGVSTHQAMTEVINAVTEGGIYDVVLTSMNVSMADDVDLLNAIKNASEKGVGIIAMKTQAGGTRLSNPETLKNFSSSIVNTASLKWVMRNQYIATSIPGFDNFEHMREDFSVAKSLEYTDDESKFLSDNNLTLGMDFCRQCQECLPSCPKGVDVPTLMRTYMYAAQYGNLTHARLTLDEIPKSKSIDICASCESCTAGCTRAVDVAHRIGELKMIYA